MDTKDVDQLRLIAVLHYVLAGFAVLGLGFLALHHAFMSVFFDNPEIWKNSKGGPPPAEFFAIFKWVYLLMGVMMIAGGIVNLVSARLIGKRRGRTFSMIVAGLNCMQFPFGTGLGVFTFIVLLRDSVRRIYAQGQGDRGANQGR